MRDRLIELLRSIPNMEPQIRGRQNGKTAYIAAHIADHLLANGVIVPPCKVGQKVYAIARWHGECVIREVDVCNYTIFDNEWKIVDLYGDYWTMDNLGKTVFLTREEAEKVLAERSGE